jgi:DNA-binding XRE family transcriptional regulator
MKPDTLRNLRVLAGLSQEGLAVSLGVSRRTIIRWEGGAWPIPRWVELALRGLTD